MRSIALFIFVVVHIVSFARAGSVSVVSEVNSCSAHGHCHGEADLQSAHHDLSSHDQDIMDFATQDSEEPHEHTHRHSPDEPEHSHPHQHSSFSHTHSVQFLSGQSFDLKVSVISTQAFLSLEDRAFQGPFLDSLFRPPIA